MQRPIFFAILLGAIAFHHSVAASAEIASDVSLALSANESDSLKAVTRLREGGREAFDKLLAIRDEIHRNAAGDRGIDPRELDRIIDRVGGARYSSVSRLFWHTDLEQAKAEARKAQKPILTLRMMGRLTEEYSSREQPIFPHHALRQPGRVPVFAGELRSALAVRASRAHGDHRLWGRPKAKADTDRQQHSLCAQCGRNRDRWSSRIVQPRAYSGVAQRVAARGRRVQPI